MTIYTAKHHAQHLRVLVVGRFYSSDLRVYVPADELPHAKNALRLAAIGCRTHGERLHNIAAAARSRGWGVK